MWTCKINRRTGAPTHSRCVYPLGWSRSGLDESGARTTADAERSKSSLSERAERVSFDDFSGAEAGVRPGHRRRDLFGSFLDPAKNEHHRGSTCIHDRHERPHWRERGTARRTADKSQPHRRGPFVAKSPHAWVRGHRALRPHSQHFGPHTGLCGPTSRSPPVDRSVCGCLHTSAGTGVAFPCLASDITPKAVVRSTDAPTLQVPCKKPHPGGPDGASLWETPGRRWPETLRAPRRNGNTRRVVVIAQRKDASCKSTRDEHAADDIVNPTVAV